MSYSDDEFSKQWNKIQEHISLIKFHYKGDDKMTLIKKLEDKLSDMENEQLKDIGYYRSCGYGC